MTTESQQKEETPHHPDVEGDIVLSVDRDEAALLYQLCVLEARRQSHPGLFRIAVDRQRGETAERLAAWIETLITAKQQEEDALVGSRSPGRAA